MYSYRNTNKKRPRTGLRRIFASGPPVFALSIAGASLFVLLNPAIGYDFGSSPAQATGARIFTEGLNIELNRESPAYAALDDAWTEPASTEEDHGNKASGNASGGDRLPSLPLAAGAISADTVAEKILSENRRERTLAEHERAAREAHNQAVALAAVNAVRSVVSKLAPPPEPTPAAVPNVAKTAVEPIDHPIQTISLTELKVNRDELLKAFFLPIVKSDKSIPIGHPVVVARHKAEPVVMNTDGAPDLPNSIMFRKAGAKPVEERARTLASERAPDTPTYRQVFISGPLEFDGGLAMANSQDRVVIYRERDGETLEAGAVWLRDGRYEIFVEDTEGLLLAELRTTYGDILGRGTFDLAKLPAQEEAPRRFDPIALKIRPVPQGITGRVLSKRAGANTKATEMADVNILMRDLHLDTNTRSNGRFSEPNLLEGSSVVVKAARLGYWGTMAFASAGQESKLEIFPDEKGQIIHELLTVTKTRDRKKPSAIIYGQVTRGGQPVAGATVELMTSEDNIQPVYFNSAMLPDLNLRVTSSNGLYAFYPVNPGAHAVQAVVAQTTTEAAVFPADDKTVSRVDLEVLVDRPAKLRVFDAFRTDVPLPALVSDLSKSRQFSVDRTGSSQIKYSSGQGPLMLDVDGGNGYQVTRVAADRSRRAIYAPMVHSSWLETIKNGLKINQAPHAGNVVGFVQGPQPYRVSIGGTENKVDALKVIYFNSRGEPTDKNFGEPGGGFVVVNVEEGFRTITIQPANMSKLYSTVVLVDPNVTNVITQWLR